MATPASDNKMFKAGITLPVLRSIEDDDVTHWIERMRYLASFATLQPIDILASIDGPAMRTV